MPTQPSRVLIVAKTYPNPSDKYEETVCTAGIDLRTHRLIRLYPVRLRDLPYEQWFSKWDVVEVNLHRRHQDSHGDTFTPEHDSLNVVGHISTWSVHYRKPPVDKCPEGGIL